MRECARVHVYACACVRLRVPVICNLKPSGQYVATDLHHAGGVPQVLKMLLEHGLLHGDCLTITGRTQQLLTAERTALNLLSRLSGIATLTAAYVAEVSGTKAIECVPMPRLCSATMSTPNRVEPIDSEQIPCITVMRNACTTP